MSEGQSEASMTQESQESFFAPVRGSFAGIIALSVLGAVSGVVPFVAIVELARTLLPALSGGEVDAGRVWGIVAVAVVALFVSFGAAFLSGMVSHFADAELQLSLRQRIVRHLQQLPLGWFDRRTSGTVRKLVENDVVALHQLVAHAIHDVVTAVAVPLISIVYLFLVQWQLALAALVPLMATAILYPLLMRGGAEKYRQYDESTAALAGATVEFVHGIAVVKRFGQLGRSHRRYRDETSTYVRFVAEWTRETAAMFTVIEIITSPVVVLVWLLTVGLGLVTAGIAAPIDVLPGLLLGLGLTSPLMRLGASAQFLRNAAKAQQSLAAFFALPAVPRPDSPRSPQGHDVAFDGLSFGYDGEHRVLHEITAACAPGTVTALVAHPGRANRRSRSWCRASTTPRRARRPSAAPTYAGSPRPSCTARPDSCSRMCSCFGRACATTSAWPAPARPIERSRRRRGRRRSTTGSCASIAATTPSSARTRTSPAERRSASRSPVPCSPTPRCSCWTRRPPSPTRIRRPRSSGRCPRSPRTGPCW